MRPTFWLDRKKGLENVSLFEGTESAFGSVVIYSLGTVENSTHVDSSSITLCYNFHLSKVSPLNKLVILLYKRQPQTAPQNPSFSPVISLIYYLLASNTPI